MNKVTASIPGLPMSCSRFTPSATFDQTADRDGQPEGGGPELAGGAVGSTMQSR